MKKYYVQLLLIFLFGCESSNLVDPSTVIVYSVAEHSHVKLNIENSYNTLIKTLVDDEKFAGIYSVQFDAANLAEGVYFYTVEARGIDNNYYHKETRKMLLVK